MSTIAAKAPTADGTASWSYSGGASAWQSVASNDGDTTYVYTSSNSDPCDFVMSNAAEVFATTMSIMAVKLVVTAKVTTGSATLKLTASDPLPSGSAFFRHDLPRESSFSLTTSYADYSVTLCNKPFTHFLSRSSEWAESAFDDYEFGFRTGTITGGGDVRVTQFRLDVIYRKETDLDTILTDERAEIFQWVEIEGVRYIFTDRALSPDDWTIGAYYFGPEYRVVPGVLATNREFRSGSINYKTGREEYETAKITLLDVTETAHECDADTGDPELVLKSQGFISWLLAYDDRTNIANTRLTDSTTSPAWNDYKGLDPKDYDGGTSGRGFTVASISGFASAGGEDSYVYIGREAIWYGAMTSPPDVNPQFGDGSDQDDIVRARFGSMNSAHHMNLDSGVYPEVTDHPVNWNGRWVRWWINAIDPVTGYPFPLSYAQARTYIWGSHDQLVGPNKNGYEVRLSSLEDKLKTKVPGVRPVRVKGLNIANFRMTITTQDGSGFQQTEEIEIGLNGPTAGTVWYENIDEFLGDSSSNAFKDQVKSVTSGAAALALTNFSFEASVKPGTGTVQFNVKYDHKVTIGLNEEAALLLGMGDGSDVIESDTPENQTGNDKAQFFYGDRPAATVFVSEKATKIYIEDDDGDDWRIEHLHAAFVIVKGKDAEEYFRLSSTSIGNDSDGDYLQTIGSAPKSFLAIAATRHRGAVVSTEAQAGVTATLGICFTGNSTQQMHQPFLQVLTSTGFNINFASGGTSYDQLPKDCGAEMDYRLLDIDSFVNISNLLKQIRCYVITSPMSIEDLMKGELLWPNGMFMRQDESGRLQWTLSRVPTTSDVDAVSILQEHWLAGTTVRVSHSRKNLLNRIVMDVDYDPVEDKFLQTLDAREPNSIGKYGVQDVTGKHYGLHTRLAGQAGAGVSHSEFRSLCFVKFKRFGFEVPSLSGQLSQRGLALLPGQGCRVTQDEVQNVRDNTGTGISAVPAEVMSIKKDDVSGECSVEILYGMNINPGGYAPAAVCSSYNNGTYVITTYDNRINTGTGDPRDASFFEVDDAVMVYSGNDLAPSVADNCNVSNVSGNAITLDGNPGFNLSDGDVIVWAGYSRLTSDQIDEGYVCVAEDGEVDTGVDPWDYG